MSVVLPYHLRLADGTYQTTEEGEELWIIAPPLLEGTLARTSVSAHFTPEEDSDPDEIQKWRVRCGDRLLRRINRLLRWYRSVSRQAEITELTRAQVSPFQFAAVGTAPVAEWLRSLEYEAAGPEPAVLTVVQMSQAVREFFKGLDFKLKNKMSAGMHLVANRSLFREPPTNFWERLSTSYSKRNAIIHRGENATEDDATQAVAVARRIVEIMGEV